MLFGYRRYDNVTGMLLELGLPSFDTVLHNCMQCFNNRYSAVDNDIVGVFRVLQ